MGCAKIEAHTVSISVVGSRSCGEGTVKDTANISLKIVKISWPDSISCPLLASDLLKILPLRE